VQKEKHQHVRSAARAGLVRAMHRVLDAIGKVYGAFQAGQFLVGLFLSEPSLEDVQKSIIDFIRMDRNDNLRAEVESLMDRMREILETLQLP